VLQAPTGLPQRQRYDAVVDVKAIQLLLCESTPKLEVLGGMVELLWTTPFHNPIRTWKKNCHVLKALCPHHQQQAL